MGAGERERLESLLRDKYGDSVVSFVHYPGLRQVSVRFVDGVKRLHDRDGEPIGRDLTVPVADPTASTFDGSLRSVGDAAATISNAPALSLVVNNPDDSGIPEDSCH